MRKFVAGLLASAVLSCSKQDNAKSAAAGDKHPVVVTSADVEQRDVPVYLNGLGSVVAFYTATVRSQVDGRVDKALFREGQEVKRGDLLYLLDLRPFEIALHQAEAALARDMAQLRNNQLNLQRDKDLRVKDLIPLQQLTDQQALVDQFEGTVLADQTQVDNAKLQLDYAHIAAPIEGRTGVRLVDPGNLVHANDANGLVVITQLEPIAVLFTLPEDDLPEIAREMKSRTLQVEAFSRDGKINLGAGTVQLIDNQINQSSGTMRLKAIFKNPDRALWPNQFVKIRLSLRTLKDAVVTPAAVVQQGPQGPFAYVIGSDSTVTNRPVQVASIEGNIAVLAHGLLPGEKVVLDGQYQLHPGSKVSARPAEGVGGAGATGDANARGAP